MARESGKRRRGATVPGTLRWSESEGRQALSTWRSSGLSLAVWCRREGLGYERVRRWKQKLESSRGSKKTAVGLPGRDAAGPRFARVAIRPSPARAGYRVRWASGIVVEWDGPVEWNELEEVLRIVGRLG